MNQRVKKLWVEALRSGKYEKGTVYLKSKTGDAVCNCVLGVLAEIAVAESIAVCVETEAWNIEPGVTISIYDYRDPKYPEEKHYGHIPHVVQAWAGLIENRQPGFQGDIPLKVEGKIRNITHWNDSTSLNFNQLADAIEAYY